jgi:hypothetical protein
VGGMQCVEVGEAAQAQACDKGAKGQHDASDNRRLPEPEE